MNLSLRSWPSRSARPRRGGIKLMELMVVVGIMVLMLGFVLAGILRAMTAVDKIRN